jgi:hypothetical protein
LAGPPKQNRRFLLFVLPLFLMLHGFGILVDKGLVGCREAQRIFAAGGQRMPTRSAKYSVFVASAVADL